MNNKAQVLQWIVMFAFVAGVILILSPQEGLVSITGLVPATPTSCGEVNESLNLSTDISGSFQCFNITVSNIVFDCKGNSITGDTTADSIAIWINNSAQGNVTIRNCRIENYYYGVYSNVTNNVTFFNNTFFNNTNGAYIVSSHDSEFIRNNFTENQYSIWGSSAASSGIVIHNNTFAATTTNYGKVSLFRFPAANFTYNTIRITSGNFADTASSSYIAHNDFIVGGYAIGGSGIYYNTIMHNRFNITSFSWGATYQYNSWGWSIINNTFIGPGGSGYGVGVNRNSDHTVVENNTISGFFIAIATGSSAWNYPTTENYTIRNNHISDSEYGIYIGQTYDSFIINNTLDNLSGYGIYLTDAPSVENNLIQDNSITNTQNTVYSANNQNNMLINTNFRLQTDYAWVDFGVVSFNISRNQSSNIEDIRFTERIAAVDSTKIPQLNKSANVSYRVVSCAYDYDIRYKETYEKSPSAFSETDPICNSTSTPTCTNIVCANDWVNFTVNHFSSYGTLPACISPRDDYQIISDGTICNGSYTLTSGMDVLQDDINVSCNGTRIYGPVTGNGFDLTEMNNITIQNCFIDGFDYGMYLDNSTNCEIINNTFNDTDHTSIYLLGGSTNNTIENNTMIRPDRGILLSQSSGNTLINPNITSTNFFDVWSQSSRNDLILTRGDNRLVFENKSINISDIDNLFINDSIVSVNASSEPAMNTSANVTLTVLNGCPTTIYYYGGFTTNATLVIFNGQICNSTSTPSCTNINCTGSTVSFGVPHFDTYVAGSCLDNDGDGFGSGPNRGGCTYPTFEDCNDNDTSIYPPADNLTISANVTFCPGDYSLTDGMDTSGNNIVITCNNTRIFGGSSNTGIYLYSGHNNTLRNCFMNGFSTAIHLYAGTGNTIINNTLNDSEGYAMFVNWGAQYNVITQNRFTRDAGGVLLLTGSTAFNNFTFNHFSNITGGSFVMWDHVDADIFNDNTFIDNTGAAFSWGNSDCFYHTAKRNIIKNNGAGVDWAYCNYCTFEDNNVTNSGSVTIAHNNSVRNNIISGGSLYVTGSIWSTDANSTIVNNTISNAAYGIYTYSNGGGSLISNNTLFNVTLGMFFQDDYSIVTGNSITDADLDFNSTVAGLTYLIDQEFRRVQPDGTILFGDSTFNFTNTTYDQMIISESFVSLNSSALPTLNKTVNITLNVSQCPVKLVKKSGFPTIRQEVVNNGQQCTDCTNIVCQDNVVNFTLGSFSGAAASAAPNVTNVILNSTNLATNDTTENLTVYVTATDPDNDSVKNIIDWRVNGTSIAILNMPFEGGSNSTFTKDYSTFGNDGNVIGANWNASRGYDGFGAYELDGNGDYVNTTDIPINGPLTLSLWVKSATPSDVGLVAGKGDDFLFGWYNVGILKWYFKTSSQLVTEYAWTPDTNWHHLVARWNGTTIQMFVDGQPQGTPTDITGTPPDISDPFIFGTGHKAVAATYFYNGSIDEVRFYNRSLSEEQILALYDDRTDLIVSQETITGDVWSAAVTPNDRTQDGITVLSNNITILNKGPTITTIFPNATNQTQDLSPADTNVSITTAPNVNLTFNVSAEDIDSDKLTFRWFVDGILKFTETLINTFVSIFNWVFTTGGQHNVTVLVNDSEYNDTFVFNVTVTCIDNDGDSFNTTDGCGVLDCDDTDSSVRPPTNGENINESTTFCPGTYNLSDGINLNASNIVVICNNTIIQRTPYGGNAVDIDGVVNATIQDCTFRNYSYGVVLWNTNNSNVINNIINNTQFDAIYLSYAYDNNVINNTVLDTNQYATYLQYSYRNNIINNFLFDTNQYATYLFYSINNNITDNTIIDSSDYGFFTIYSDDNDFIRNNLTNTLGIWVITSNNSVFNGNYLSVSEEPFWADGGSNNLTIINNVFINNFYGIYLGYSGDYSHNNIFVNNTIGNTTDYGLYIQGSNNLVENNTIYDSDNSGVYLIEAYNNTFNHNTLYDNPMGIEFNTPSPNDIITNNIITNGLYGISLIAGDNITIVNNTITNAATKAISSSSTITNSSFVNNYVINSPYGIHLQGYPDNGNDFINNTMINISADGISVCSEGENYFANNNISGTGTYGISEACGVASNSKFMSNIITGLTTSIYLNAGSPYHVEVRGNTVRDGTYGIHFNGGGARNLTIKNNNVINFSTGGIYSCADSVYNLTVVNNTVYDSSSSVVFACGGVDDYVIENNTLIGSTTVGISLGGIGSTPNPEIVRNNNLSCSAGDGISFTATTSYNVTLTLNTISSCDNGIVLDGGAVQNSFIAENIISNISQVGISFETNSAAQNTVQNNTFTNNAYDIHTSLGAGVNTLVINELENELRFINKTLNISDIDNLHIGTRIASVDSSTEHWMNVSAQITLAGLNNPSTPTIYKWENFTTNANEVVNNGVACNTTICTDVNYSSGTLVFNVPHFSSYAVPTYTPPSGGGCTPDWSCGDWSACNSNGTQTRTCTDLDGCRSDRVEVQSCTACVDECTIGEFICFDASQRFRSTKEYLQTCVDFDGDGCSEFIGNECAQDESCATGACIDEEVPPTEEFPTPIDTETSIELSKVDPNPFSCMLVNKTEIEEPIISTTKEPFMGELEEGYEVIIPPFNLDCTADLFDLSLTIPDNYIDVKALSCRAGQCTPVEVTQIEQLVCGGELFEELSRETIYLNPELFTVNITKTELSPGDDVLESSMNRIKFIGDLKGSVTLEQPTAPVKEAENPGIKIVGTPVILTFDQENPDISTEITIPYVLPEDIDEFSLSLYVITGENWKYLGGVVNTTSKTVSTTVENIMQYSEDNKVTLALMGLPCVACLEVELEKVYQGTSRDAVVLVHGFTSSPAAFQYILDDIRLTAQPWQAWVLGYPSHKTIDDNAKDFADLMQAKSREFDYVYLVGHSLGGSITQQMIRYAYEQNQIRAGTYTFLDKIKKVILIASPNKGSLHEQIYGELFDFLLNSRTVHALFNLNSVLLKELVQGRTIDRVPGLDYYVIAGTGNYPFTKLLGKNDGTVSTESAQTIGDIIVNDQCKDYWEINVSHTALVDNYESRQIIERIVAKEIAESLSGKALIGYNQYFNLHVTECALGDQYVLIGKLITEEEVSAPAECACGNGVCGVGEDELNCPSDCAEIRQVAGIPIDVILRLLKPLLWPLLLLALLIAMYKGAPVAYRRVLGTGKSRIEEGLNELIIHTRVNVRTGNLDEAVELYERFNRNYSDSPPWVKDRFRGVRDDLEQEMRRSLN
ncbi:alpha/beta fold hydrolase [Nanoarchaeota archaeon]